MLAGRVDGQKRSLSAMFEATGAYAAGKIDDEKLRGFEEKVCPTCGSCSGMYTANSMNCLTEVLGLAFLVMVQFLQFIQLVSSLLSTLVCRLWSVLERIFALEIF